MTKTVTFTWNIQALSITDCFKTQYKITFYLSYTNTEFATGDFWKWEMSSIILNIKLFYCKIRMNYIHKKCSGWAKITLQKVSRVYLWEVVWHGYKGMTRCGGKLYQFSIKLMLEKWVRLSTNPLQIRYRIIILSSI